MDRVMDRVPPKWWFYKLVALVGLLYFGWYVAWIPGLFLVGTAYAVGWYAK